MGVLSAAYWRRLYADEGYISTGVLGSVAELVADPKGLVEQALTDCITNGWKLLFEPIPDGTPWEWRYFDFTLTDNLHIHFDKEAVIKPTVNFQHFATGGSTGPFAITDFDYDPSPEGPLAAMMVDSSNNETRLVQDTDFTVALNGPNYEVTLSATPSAGDTLVVVARKNAFQIRSTPGNGVRLTLQGVLNIDNSRYGYAVDSPSGAALSITNVDNWWLDTLITDAGVENGWTADPLDRRGDNHFVPLNFVNGFAKRIEVKGGASAAVYATGGSAFATTDDGRNLHIQSLYASGTAKVLQAVRGVENVTVDAIHAYECRDVVLQEIIGSAQPGRNFHVGSLQAIRSGRSVIDWSDMSYGGVSFDSVQIRDWGYKPDETTLVSDANAVKLNGVSGVNIANMSASQRDFPVPTSRAVVETSGDNNFGNRVLSGYFDGYDIGISETGGTANDVGNDYNVTMKDVTTPLSLEANSTATYDLKILTEAGGTITAEPLTKKPRSPAYRRELYAEEGFLSTSVLGSTAEITADPKGMIEQALADCHTNGWRMHFDPIPDGSPWEWRYLDHNLTTDLHIHFHKDALIKPTLNYQHFATSGSTGPFVITDFDYNPASEGNLSAMIVDSSNGETKLYEDTDFTVALNGGNYEVTLSATPAAGDTLAVASAKNALQLRSTSGNGRRLTLTGIANFDTSRYGYISASASGSALSITNVDEFFLDTLLADAGAATGWDVDPLLRRGDSGFVPLNFKRGYARRVEAIGMCDMAVYVSGGGDAGTGDDSRNLHIESIVANRCMHAFKAVRTSESMSVDSIQAYECFNVLLCGETSGLPMGQNLRFGNVQAIRTGETIIDWQDFVGGAHVETLQIRDWGYKPDETTAITSANGIFLAGCAGVTIGHLNAKQRDFPVPSGLPVVKISGDNNYGNKIVSGYIDGYDVGISETGLTTNDVGNDYSLIMKDVATPLSLGAGSDTTYDLTLLTETGGVITPQRKLRKLFRRQWTTDSGGSTPPRLFLSGSAAPTHAFEEGTMLYDGCERLTVSANLQVNGAEWVHSSSAQLRVLLPYGYIADSLDGEEQVLPVLAYDGIDIGGAIASDTVQIEAVLSDGDDYIFFRYYDHASQSGGNITGDHCPSGGTIRIAFSGTFFATET